MNNPKNDEYYVSKIMTDLKFIAEHMENVDRKALEENELLLDAMLFRLIQIKENANNLSEAYKIKHENIPWTDINGLRNRIVHDYGNVDLEIVYITLKRDIPDLICQFSTEV